MNFASQVYQHLVKFVDVWCTRTKDDLQCHSISWVGY